MLAYVLRRVLYAIPILLGVHAITFILFFSVNSPADMARMHLGPKYQTQQAVQQWIVEHHYDKAQFYNPRALGINKLTDTLFFQEFSTLFTFHFGHSDSGRNISQDIRQRMVPSLMISVPSLCLRLFIHISFALSLVFFRYTYIEQLGVCLCIILMSVSALFYIMFGQYFFAEMLQLFPISGYRPGVESIKFITLPVIVAVVSSLGAATRWYRALFIEEMSKDYVRTARVKGLSSFASLFRHVLPNTLLPILTGVVTIIPSLFMGSLLLESFFGIPGLGSYVLDAIAQQDFAIVRVMVFLGTFLYIVGLVLTDLSYVIADPRVRLSAA